MSRTHVKLPAMIRPRPSDRGQGLVEFALIFPILVFVLFGVFDFGRAIYDYNTLANAARQGVRVAIVNQNGAGTGCDAGSAGTPPNTTKQSAHDCAVRAGILLPGMTAVVDYRNLTDTADCEPVQVGCIATVTTSFTFRPITPFLSALVGAIPLSSKAEEPVEFVCPISASTCVPGQ